ncbi:hypothetical protein [Natronobacterium texcoconense]|uniref:Uncharacterized protein n=1 Tax=Natronobacterium texcoconense TaxID=1095778 RepID=A0A1H1FK81_NATTX|nr:hypothetical protein [Natronobacterium texcoconense]SDR01325.1 hypothetical protein SAMN04489842_2001 [Natronobacterium texcoconense]
MIGQRSNSGLEPTPFGVEGTFSGRLVPLDTQAVGGSPELVVLVFLALLVATVLSVYLAVRLYRGYRAGGGVGMLLLGAGLVLLTTIPMLLRLVLSNMPAVAPVWQEVIATAVQLLGLLVILGVVYGRR